MTALPLVIWGASGHASVVADIVRTEGRFEIVGLLDDQDPMRQVPFGRVLGGSSELPSVLAGGVRHLIVAVGDNGARRRLAGSAQALGFELVTAIHPRATVAADVAVGPGTVVMAGAVVNPGAAIGSNVIVNTCSSIDHDCVLGNGVHVCPGAHLAGRVTVGDGTFIGIGTLVRNDIRIGAESVIGAGSCVLDDLPAGVLAYGSPARVVRTLTPVAV